MSLTSIFQTPRPVGTEWDMLHDEGGVLRSRGRVQSYSDFESGYDGWADHFSAGILRMPISLSTEIAAVHGNTSLKLSTATKAYVSATDATGGSDADSTMNANAYKRMGGYRETGLVSISGYFAVRHGGTNASQPITRRIGMGLDMQKQDNSSRAFPRIYYEGNFSADGSGTSRVTVQGDSALVAVTGSSNVGPGANEDKANWGYMRLTYDRSANGGLGGYVECQVNSFVFDLRTLMGTDRASQTPQVTANSPLTDYRGGLNAGLFIQRFTDSGTASQFPAIGYFKHINVTLGDVLA